MMKLRLSPAAAGLLRALLARANVDRNRILLSAFRSTDWQSLTFVGERHEIELRVTGQGSGEIAGRIAERLEDAEFAVPGHIVADIRLGEISTLPCGGRELKIEALTIAE